MKKKVGFIGAGNMASAILNGILGSELREQLELCVFDLDATKCSVWQERGVKSCTSSAELAAGSDTIFLAIKPQNFEEALQEIRPVCRQDTVFVSIAAGITDDYIRLALGFSAKVILTMPNTPLLLGMGATALSKNEATSDAEFAFVCTIFSKAGQIEVIPKDKMKEIIAINGSSPAFIYLFAKGFIEYATANGIDEKAAVHLFCATLKGAAEMMERSGFSIDELIRMVSSPGGTTLEGIAIFQESGLVSTVNAACAACTKRAYELEK